MATTCQHKITIALSAFCLLISPLLLQAQQETNRDEVIIPMIKMEAVPILDAIKNLARQVSLNYIIDPHVPYADFPPLTITMTNFTAIEALDRVLKLRRLVRVENPATSVTRIAPADADVKRVSPEQIGNDTNAAVPVILFEEVPLKDALQALANQLRVKITFDGKFMAEHAGNSITYISVRWKNLTLKQALVALLDNYDLILMPNQSGSSSRITSKEEVPKSKSSQSVQ